MSSRSNPFEELERFLERMSRQFGEASRSWNPDEAIEMWTPDAHSTAVDLVEHDDEFVATTDLPGFERDDVDIRVTDETLRISAERDRESEATEEDYIHQERRHESISRSIQLPEEVDTDEVSARMETGVSPVTLPRLEIPGARSIDIEWARAVEMASYSPIETSATARKRSKSGNLAAPSLGCRSTVRGASRRGGPFGSVRRRRRGLLRAV